MVACCVARDEFRHLSTDATLRCARNIVGQGDYKASKKIRNACRIPDGEALRRVLTVRGRIGAPLLMELILEENSDCVATCFRKECSTYVLNSIQSIASDAPRNVFFQIYVPGMSKLVDHAGGSRPSLHYL